MDYNKIYIELMERSFTRSLNGYSEKHHIIPRCMGGDDKQRNIAILTPEEHFLAHQLLLKIYPTNKKLMYACNMMVADSNGNRVNNKFYGWLKKRLSRIKSEDMKGRKLTEEHKSKLSKANKGKQNSLGKRNRLGFKTSEETRVKISNSKKGKTPTSYIHKRFQNIQRPDGSYVGVSKHRNRYVAGITINKRRVIIGSFLNELDASNAFQQYKKDNNL